MCLYVYFCIVLSLGQEWYPFQKNDVDLQHKGIVHNQI